MILKIILYGNPLLTKISKPVNREYPLNILIRDMYETLHATKGVGLAAVQVGVPYRLFITDFTENGEEFKEVFINPKIIREWGNPVALVEGCLSFPGIAAEIKRKRNVELSYEDIEGKHFTKIFTGVQARIIQHEMDHVEGRYFIDNIEYVDRMSIISNLSKIENRELAELSYQVI